MQKPQSTYKIYSRKRLNILNSKNPQNRNMQKKMKRFIPILMVFIIAITFCYLVWKSINPIFRTLCEDEAKAIATKITNEESTKVMEKHSYDELFKISRGEDGEIQMISANVISIDQITSDIAINVQKSLDSYESGEVKLPLGMISGIKFFAGSGPNIKIKLATVGSVITDVRSEFTAQGVNQTLHRVYLQIDCTVNVLTPFDITKENISNQVLLLENVILGNVPSTYYNLEGMSSTSDTFKFMD